VVAGSWISDREAMEITLNPPLPGEQPGFIVVRRPGSGL